MKLRHVQISNSICFVYVHMNCLRFNYFTVMNVTNMYLLICTTYTLVAIVLVGLTAGREAGSQMK